MTIQFFEVKFTYLVYVVQALGFKNQLNVTFLQDFPHIKLFTRCYNMSNNVSLTSEN